jgi:hypothetical protein
VGCQRLQATPTGILEIIIGPDAPDHVDPPVTSEFDDSPFAGYYKIDDDDGADP